MTIIFAHKVEVFSFPLSNDLAHGYNDLVTRVCEIKTQKGNWTGFLVNDTVLASGLPDHEKEFDVQFYKQPQTSGFLLHDFGDVIEVGVGQVPHVDRVAGMPRHPLPKERLFVIGNFFGKPFEIATCHVLLVGSVKNLDCMKGHMIDTHASGSPVFNHDGSVVGMVEAYVPLKDQLIIRALVTNEHGMIA